MVYARLSKYRAMPGMASALEQVPTTFQPMVEAQPGFRGATYLANDDTGEFAVLTLWDTEEGADLLGETVVPRVLECMRDVFRGPPEVTIYEVMDQR